MKDQRGPNLWIDNGVAATNAQLRLFCFPPAGGASSFFRPWLDCKPDGIEICPVQLPGREQRSQERPFNQLRPLVSALAEAIPFDRQFAFFGHSMGALISFELARELRRRGLPGPNHLFVSAAPAPQLPLKPARYLLPQDAFVKELRRLGGTAEIILSDDAILQYFMPVLRADFGIVDTYEYLKEDRIDCPIYAFGGEKDLEVDRKDLASWQVMTREFRLQIFKGDHFYLVNIWATLIGAISDALGAVCRV